MDADANRALAHLVRDSRRAHLATLRDGAPLASMVLYLPGGDFSTVFVHVSELAWHTQDMKREPRVALSIAEHDDGREDLYTFGRLTLRGEAVRIANTDARVAELKRDWLARYPASAINFDLADFAFWRIAVRDARYVAGYGAIHNLAVAQLQEASRS